MDEWMECQANMHKYKNMSMVVYMHIFVCVHGLISLSHILTPSKVYTIFKHSWHTIQKLFQMWIHSLELEFHPLHTQSVSFIHSLTRSLARSFIDVGHPLFSCIPCTRNRTKTFVGTLIGIKCCVQLKIQLFKGIFLRSLLSSIYRVRLPVYVFECDTMVCLLCVYNA